VRLRLAVLIAATLLPGAASLRAQAVGGTRVGIVRTPQDRPAPSDTIVGQLVEPGAPITPRRAFFSSLLVPGTGQAALDRPYAGGVFMLVEAISLTMMHRSAEDARLARSFARDSLPLTYQTDPITGVVAVDSLGNPIVTSWAQSRYGEGIARARRLHLEDWVAVLFFNHLFSGADAYVAALLWDLPEKVSLVRTPMGPAISTRVWFGRPRRR
jgi:hypothetical protein